MNQFNFFFFCFLLFLWKRFVQMWLKEMQQIPLDFTRDEKLFLLEYCASGVGNIRDRRRTARDNVDFKSSDGKGSYSDLIGLYCVCFLFFLFMQTCNGFIFRSNIFFVVVGVFTFFFFFRKLLKKIYLKKIIFFIAFFFEGVPLVPLHNGNFAKFGAADDVDQMIIGTELVTNIIHNTVS